jgi:hypothetical protein
MAAEAQPQCPDCTYLLTGLSTPRCPECGLQFDVRLLTDPALARPRPAWERRRNVSFVAAVWRTVIDVTFRPAAFFAGIQQSDRLRRSIYWPALMALLTGVVGILYLVGTHPILGFSSPELGMSGWAFWRTALVGGAITLLWTCVLVLSPVAVMLLVADLVLWHDRARYRLFSKCALYGVTVYLWPVLLACLVGVILKCAGQAGRPPFNSTYTLPWTNWLLAGGMTWQFALIHHAVADRRFAGLLPTQTRHQAALALLVITVWLGGMYLVLIDRHLGLRFTSASWSWELLI